MCWSTAMQLSCATARACRCDDPSADVPLGPKYGADMADVEGLLGAARDLGLQVGASGHGLLGRKAARHHAPPG